MHAKNLQPADRNRKYDSISKDRNETYDDKLHFNLCLSTEVIYDI